MSARKSQAAGVPDCPEHLDAAAKTEWRRIVRELKAAGTLTKCDRAALAAYCQTWSRWTAAEIAIREHGPIVKSPNGYPIQNPHLPIATKALEQLRKFIAELGLSPASRARVKPQCKPKPQNSDDSPLAGIRLRRAN